ncbi:MAG: hypothetical protein BJ554DRAFT_6413 [Olpidium bornovanus]|uniref:Uncharacterized protein n=1 Tax=Olpidium bornovanus TaxID=278681 RepID=A0A8H7ZY78_9FUNG|nr:MAG: hypothetical protein BJ554DRAFT_6413 [Olpidium bornovanus]
MERYRRAPRLAGTPDSPHVPGHRATARLALSRFTANLEEGHYWPALKTLRGPPPPPLLRTTFSGWRRRCALAPYPDGGMTQRSFSARRPPVQDRFVARRRALPEESLPVATVRRSNVSRGRNAQKIKTKTALR